MDIMKYIFYRQAEQGHEAFGLSENYVIFQKHKN